jgi:hypothetical protein
MHKGGQAYTTCDGANVTPFMSSNVIEILPGMNYHTRRGTCHCPDIAILHVGTHDLCLGVDIRLSAPLNRDLGWSHDVYVGRRIIKA